MALKLNNNKSYFVFKKKNLKSKLTILLTSLFSLTAYVCKTIEAFVFICFSEHKIQLIRVWIKEIILFLIFFKKNCTPRYKHLRWRNIINQELHNFVDKVAIIEWHPWNWYNKSMFLSFLNLSMPPIRQTKCVWQTTTNGKIRI